MILFSKELSSKFDLVKIETLIKPRKERCKISDIPDNSRIVSKIRFSDGCVFFNDKPGKNTMIKSSCNDLLASNINFEKGAFAINTFGDLFASTDYTSYIINTEIILPEYLFQVLRCRVFSEYITAVKPKGLKPRARYDFIKEFSIPLPSIQKQKSIIKTFHATLEEAKKKVTEGDNFTRRLLLNLQTEVSNYNNHNGSSSKLSSIMQLVPFTSTYRWDTNYVLNADCLPRIYDSFQYDTYRIGELVVESLFGLSVKASETQETDMIPMLRMGNIVNGEIDFSDLKFLPMQYAITEDEPNKWLLKIDDFLVVRTNGSKELVGKSAVFHDHSQYSDYTYASYLIRYRFNTSIVLPDYINILFMMPIVREQIAVFRRQGGGQYNLNSDEIEDIKIPVPPISKQKEIIKSYNSVKKNAEAFYKKAQTFREKAASDFENAIFL